jgi:hypothetical protein
MEKPEFPIRDIEFRLGLNVIGTKQPKKGETRPVGHNVGKTLLTRLIRYCLGENYFGTEATRKAVAEKYPSGYVVAEIRLQETDWVVARPIGASAASEAWCVQATDWRAILDDQGNYQPYSHFQELLNLKLAKQHSEFPLPNAGKATSWLNVLAWLARDQYCRYRNPLEWRSSQAGSQNSELHAEDAAFVVRMVMNVLDRSERELALTHKLLLKSQEKQQAAVDTIQSAVVRTEQFLRKRLSIDPHQFKDELFANVAQDEAKKRLKAADEAVRKARGDVELTRLRGLARQAEEAHIRANQDLIRQQEIRGKKQEELAINEKEIMKSVTSRLGSFLVNCTLSETACPNKMAAEPGKPHPSRKLAIQVIKAEIEELNTLIGKLTITQNNLEAKSKDAGKAFDDYENSVQSKILAAQKKVAIASLVVDEVKSLLDELAKLEKQVKQLERIKGDVESSRREHVKARGRVARNRAILNTHLNRVLASLVGDETKGTIEFDMRGLQLRLLNQEAQQGEGLATAELVLALDLACLSASICGLGTHPRFLIHDSPREGDLELHIYLQLFGFLRSLEDGFESGLPSFQYIVTTTTPPPEEMTQLPYCRASFSRDSEKNTLLGKKY